MPRVAASVFAQDPLKEEDVPDSGLAPEARCAPDAVVTPGHLVDRDQVVAPGHLAAPDHLVAPGAGVDPEELLDGDHVGAAEDGPGLEHLLGPGHLEPGNGVLVGQAP